MGVMACDRKGCENILCDHYSDKYGYLCYSCYNELIETGPWLDIDLFMASDKPDQYSKQSWELQVKLEFSNE